MVIEDCLERDSKSREGKRVRVFKELERQGTAMAVEK